MCGRYYRTRKERELAQYFGVGTLFTGELQPDYNIAPHTFQPVIRQSRDEKSLEMVPMLWGLIPFFAKSGAEKSYNTINARAETIERVPTFRAPIQKRRALIPADGFYEWRRHSPSKEIGAKAVKTPYAFSLLSGEPIAFAGVWDAWKEGPSEVEERRRKAWNAALIRVRDRLMETNGGAPVARVELSRAVEEDPTYIAESNPEPQWVQSFSIITTEANELMAPVHNRMPVIIRKRDQERWLDREEHRPPIDLLRPFDSEEMLMQPCNPAVGKVGNNGPEMLACPTPDEGPRINSA